MSSGRRATAQAIRTDLSITETGDWGNYLRISSPGAASFAVEQTVAELTTADGDGADVYVEWGLGDDTNFNGSANNPNLELKVQKHTTADATRKTYLRFDMTTATTQIDQVDLVLEVRIENAVRISVYGLNDGASGDGAPGSGGWDETTLTWNNAPANNTASADGVTSAATLLDTFDMIDTADHPSGPYALSSYDHAALLNFINSDTNDLVTFILTGSDSIGGDGGLAANFWSKEHTPSGGSAGDLAPLLLFNGPPPQPPPGNGDGEPAVSYEVSLTLPTYDPNNSEHMLIDSNADWDQINSSTKRIFFVTPGDYRGKGTITLTADGTSSAKRWILWYDPNNPTDTTTHPRDMPSASRAFIDRVVFDNASHWIIDRIRINKGSNLNNTSNNNVLNRLMIYQMSLANGRTSIGIFTNSNFNTIQNSQRLGRQPQRSQHHGETDYQSEHRDDSQREGHLQQPTRQLVRLVIDLSAKELIRRRGSLRSPSAFQGFTTTCAVTSTPPRSNCPSLASGAWCWP